MEKENIEFPQHAEEILDILKKGRVLLVAQGMDGKPNPMTIAWGSMMFAWNKPIFVAMVRDSRHTFKLLEESDSFTVNFFKENHQGAMGFCGSKSGRDYDKFKETNLTPTKSKRVQTPIVEEAFLHMECKILCKQALDLSQMNEEIVKTYYPEGVAEKSNHILYYGEIMALYGDMEK
ncbi:MAG: flavin reductase family protein [Thermotaleaceae bacterium]